MRVCVRALSIKVVGKFGVGVFNLTKNATTVIFFS